MLRKKVPEDPGLFPNRSNPDAGTNQPPGGPLSNPSEGTNTRFRSEDREFARVQTRPAVRGPTNRPDRVGRRMLVVLNVEPDAASDIWYRLIKFLGLKQGHRRASRRIATYGDYEDKDGDPRVFVSTDWIGIGKKWKDTLAPRC